MRITCPHCGHSREVAEDRLPAGEIRVTCPSCGQHFPINPDRETPAPTAERQENETVPAPVAPPEAPAPEENRHPPLSSPDPAGFWIRAVAALVDSVVAGLLEVGMAFLFVAVLHRLEGIFGPGYNEDYIQTLTVLYSFATGIAYYVFFTGHCGQTPGKMALRIKVIRDDGAEIGYGRAFIRETVGKFFSAALLGIGYLMVAFTRRKQGLHDKLAGTLVIKIS